MSAERRPRDAKVRTPTTSRRSRSCQPADSDTVYTSGKSWTCLSCSAWTPCVVCQSCKPNSLIRAYRNSSKLADHKNPYLCHQPETRESNSQQNSVHHPDSISKVVIKGECETVSDCDPHSHIGCYSKHSSHDKDDMKHSTRYQSDHCYENGRYFKRRRPPRRDIHHQRRPRGRSKGEPFSNSDEDPSTVTDSLHRKHSDERPHKRSGSLKPSTTAFYNPEISEVNFNRGKSRCKTLVYSKKIGDSARPSFDPSCNTNLCISNNSIGYGSFHTRQTEAKTEHACPWEAECTINGTVRGHCSATTDKVAHNLRGKFRASGISHHTGSCLQSNPECGKEVRFRIGCTDDGRYMDFSKDQDPVFIRCHQGGIGADKDNYISGKPTTCDTGARSPSERKRNCVSASGRDSDSFIQVTKPTQSTPNKGYDVPDDEDNKNQNLYNPSKKFTSYPKYNHYKLPYKNNETSFIETENDSERKTRNRTTSSPNKTCFNTEKRFQQNHSDMPDFDSIFEKYLSESRADKTSTVKDTPRFSSSINSKYVENKTPSRQEDHGDISTRRHIPHEKKYVKSISDDDPLPRSYNCNTTFLEGIANHYHGNSSQQRNSNQCCKRSPHLDNHLNHLYHTPSPSKPTVGSTHFSGSRLKHNLMRLMSAAKKI